MKELILENPRKGKKTSKARKASKSGKRRSPAQRAATAKLVALSKKRSKKTKSSRKARKSSKSRKSRKTSTVKIMATKSKRKRSKCASKTSRRRIYALKGSLKRIKLNPFTGNVFTKENLGIAGGAVAGTVVSNYALTMLAGRYGSMNPYARAAYNVAIPVIGAMLFKRFSPSIAKGMIIGGLANGIGQLVTASGVGPAGITSPIQVSNTSSSAPATSQVSAYCGEYVGEYVGADPTGGNAFSSAW